MHLGDVEASEPKMISYFFRKFFVQSYASQSVTHVVGYPYDTSSNIGFSTAQVFVDLCRLKFSCISRPDGIPASILQLRKYVICL